MSFQPTRLDVEPSIISSNLMMVDSPDESLFPSSLIPEKRLVEEFNTLLPEPDYPSITAVPKPGLCIKTRNEAGSKFFVNLCKIDELQRPAPMEEKELERMIATEDYSNLWRIPMSIGQPRKEKDKSGEDCLAAEVAINSKWFDDTMADSEIFTGFVITVAIEGLGEKYGAEARLDREKWTVLKNKRAMGATLPPHRIQLRASAGIEAVDEKDIVPKKPAAIKSALTSSKPVVKNTIVQQKAESLQNQPEFKLIAEPSIAEPSQLRLTAHLPGVSSSRELVLDIGEDRIVMCSTRHNYLLDIFVPYTLFPEITTASFCAKTAELVLILPINSS